MLPFNFDEGAHDNSWLAGKGPDKMAAVYDEVEIEDMEFDAEEQVYYYPCPCGDRFCIDLEELYDGEDIATCPSCSLTIRVIYDEESLPELKEEE